MPMNHIQTIADTTGADRSAAGIATTIGRLINHGTLEGGDRLPTVRALARSLDVSPSIVADAWRRLQHAGLLDTAGRRGSFVRARRRPNEPGRFWQVPVHRHTYRLDLSTGTPDPALLPPLGPALAALHDQPPVSSYLDQPMLPALAEVLDERWPFKPEALTIVNGAIDALDRVISTVVGYGDRVLVEDPGFPPILDMLELAGAELIPVPFVDGGLDPDALAAGLAAEPSLLILQPRAHNPTGWSHDAGRMERLADLLDGTEVFVIEDDHSGEVSGAPLYSLGTRMPDRVVHIRSFSKAYGPDLRLAAIGGAAPVVDAVVHRRQLGPVWSSRLLQNVLLNLLTDPATTEIVARAEAAYAERRSTLVDCLADHGIAVPGRSGFNLWLEVEDETNALIALSAKGIGAAPGSPFVVGNGGGSHLRLTVATVAGDFGELAAVIAQAASIPPGRRVGA